MIEKLVGGEAGVGSLDGRTRHAIDIVAAVWETSYALVASMPVIRDDIGEAGEGWMGLEKIRIGRDEVFGRSDGDSLMVGIGELIWRVELRDRRKFVGPNYKMPMGRDDGAVGIGISRRELIGQRATEVVADGEAADIKRTIGGVVEFEPVVVLEIVAHKDVVGSTYFVDADREGEAVGEMFVWDTLEMRGEGVSASAAEVVEADGRRGGEGFAGGLCKRRTPEDVG